MRARFLIACCFLLVATSCEGSECHGKPSPSAQPNLNPIIIGKPTYIKSVKNGKLYTVGSGDIVIPVVHLWGSPYEMGYAHGELMADKAKDLVESVWSYLESQIEEAINGSQAVSLFPSWFLKDVANFGLDVALDMETDATRPFTGRYFFDELRGLSSSAGINFKKVERIHMIGELTKGHCSMFGANASAVPAGNGLLQLRALDWNVDGPFKNFPQITVYHPSDPKYGHAFANIGFTGWIGSITGFSSLQLSISEIGVSFPDDTFKHESRFGTPFTYLLRDIIQFDKTLYDALNRISSAHRTCNLILGVGDAKINEFRGIEYSASTADFFTWETLRPAEDWHPHITDVVYWGMDWLCPGYNQVLGQQLERYYGNITPEATIRDIVPIVQTGNLHIAVYDMTKHSVYVSYARPDGAAGPLYAYERSFVQLDSDELFAEKEPSLA